MRSDVEDLSLTPSEREIARVHWDAMMFAPSRSDLEKARLALMDAPFAIQQAVIADINANWLREYEPKREENPFLPPVSFQDVTPVAKEETSEELPLEPNESYHLETVADYSLTTHSVLSQSLAAYAQRFIQGISHLATPKFGERIDSHNSSLHSASPHH